MVVMAENAQDQGLRARVDVMAVGDAEAAEPVGSRRRKKHQTEIRGEHVDVASKELCAGTVSPDPVEEADGTLGDARTAVKKKKAAAVKKKKKGSCAGTVSTTGDSKVKSALSLGYFGTAMEAARPYDAAAVELRGASAVTNFKPSGDSSGSQAAGSDKMKVKKPAAAKFRGVHRLPSGNYRARISKGKSMVWLGTFGTAEEAARAFDAAAVKLRGAAARTNFEQQTTAAGTTFEPYFTAAAADDGEVWSTDIPNDFPELPPVTFSESLIPGPQMDDLGADFPTAADLQLVHEFLKDFDQVVV